jgi:hypothetical protein
VIYIFSFPLKQISSSQKKNTYCFVCQILISLAIFINPEAIRHHSSPSFNSILTLQFSRNFDYNNNAEILRASISISNPKSLEKFQNPFPKISETLNLSWLLLFELKNPKSMLLVVVSAVYMNAGFPLLLLEISSAGYGGYDSGRVYLRASVSSSLRLWL